MMTSRADRQGRRRNYRNSCWLAHWHGGCSYFLAMKTEKIRYVWPGVFGLLFCLFLPGETLAAELQKSERSGAELQASFQYLLSNFAGPVPSQWARLAFDPVRQEIYTLNQGLNDVQIYNQQGMEIFDFGGDGDIVAGVDIAAGAAGQIYLLARDFTRNAIQVLNYRGEPEAVIHLKGLPETFTQFSPERMEYRGGLIYLLDPSALQIVVLGPDGAFRQGHDLTAQFSALAKEQDPDKKKSLDLEISGFSVGADGSLYFTVPTLFSAFRLSPEGSLNRFGDSGSGPGKFGVVAGIVSDDKGTIYVADRLRSVVLLFDQSFTFQGEFGYRGGRAEDLLVPDDLVIDSAGSRVFVAQAANKGVGVYHISLAQRR